MRKWMLIGAMSSVLLTACSTQADNNTEVQQLKVENDKLQKELRQKELLFVFPLFIAFLVITSFLNYPVVRIGVALLFVILYGRKRLELKKQGLQGGKLMNLIFDHWKVSLSVFIIICVISFFM